MADPKTTEGAGLCQDCGEPCAGTWEDQGIGSYEFWGQLGTDVRWCWSSECCGGLIVDEDGKEVEAPEDPRY